MSTTALTENPPVDPLTTKLEESLQREYWIPGTPHFIGCHVNLYYINDIDTQAQTFKCGILVETTWQPSKTDVENYRRLKAAGRCHEFRPEFVPQIRLQNCVAMEYEKRFAALDGAEYLLLEEGVYNPNDGIGTSYSGPIPYLIQSNWEVRGSFVEPFELANFPVDIQDLKIVIMSTCSSQVQVMVPCFTKTCVARFMDELSTLTLPDWRYERSVAEFICDECIIEDETNSGGEIVEPNRYSNFVVSMKFSRKYQSYIYRVVVFTCFFPFCMMGVFLVDPEEGAVDRRRTSVSLLLASLLFMFVVMRDLPHGVPYLTLLEKYIYSSLLFQVLVLIQNFVIEKVEEKEEFDRICQTAAGVLWVLIQLACGIHAYRMRVWERSKLQMTSKQIAEVQREDRRMDVHAHGGQSHNLTCWDEGCLVTGEFSL